MKVNVNASNQLVLLFRSLSMEHLFHSFLSPLRSPSTSSSYFVFRSKFSFSSFHHNHLPDSFLLLSSRIISSLLSIHTLARDSVFANLSDKEKMKRIGGAGGELPLLKINLQKNPKLFTSSQILPINTRGEEISH